MKVGIITHHSIPNCGANLQALSTSLALKKLGHEAVIINYQVDEINKRYLSSTTPEQIAKHNKFVYDYLNVTNVCRNSNDVKSIAEKETLDAVISGSDAVLRLNPLQPDRDDMSFPNPFWLNWADEIGIKKRGFLASSCMGSNFLSQCKSVRMDIKEAVDALNFCSVRDTWTALMLKSCRVPEDAINFCPDPVSQIITNEMLSLTPAINRPQGKIVLLSFYAKTASKTWIIELIKSLKSRGYTTVSFPQPDHPCQIPTDIEIQLPLSPMEWLAWLNASDGYIGVRFHPIVISQALGKPFIALDYYDNGIPFGNRLLRKAAKLARPLTRDISKTYDLAKRVKLEEFVIPKRRIKKIQPMKVVELFEKAGRQTTSLENRKYRSTEFDTCLNSIVG